MERVCQFLKDAQVYYLATVEGDQPRVRPFGTAHIFEGKLYIQTGRTKDCAKQIASNPKVEVCAFKDGVWLRLAGTLVDDDRVEAKKSLLDAYPSLQDRYSAEDHNTQVLYFKDATATFSSFTAPPETVKF
ncbi:MAG: pyridoxamine 5'-phosphate oxidase family protein [Oscillospiraceae bacterium]|nr:pyridoxamine 5'-phosphate oxidase family protein [Oscillospiraceae bacterium]